MLLTANPNRITSTPGHFESVLVHNSPYTFKKQTNKQNSDGCEQDRCRMHGAGLAARKGSGPSVKVEERETVQVSRISRVATTVSPKDISGVHLDVFLSNLRPANRMDWKRREKSRRGKKSSPLTCGRPIWSPSYDGSQY